MPDQASVQVWFNVLKEFNICNDLKLQKMRVEAATMMAEMANAMNPRWLSMLGPSGTGKTFLANLIGARAEILAKIADHDRLRFGIQFVYWPAMLDRLRDGKYWVLNDAVEANLLILDELCLEHDPNGFGADKLCRLLSQRCGKWTVITSNLTFAKIEAIDTRISSRMIRDGSVVLEVTAMDYALRR